MICVRKRISRKTKLALTQLRSFQKIIRTLAYRSRKQFVNSIILIQNSWYRTYSLTANSVNLNLRSIGVKVSTVQAGGGKSLGREKPLNVYGNLNIGRKSRADQVVGSTFQCLNPARNRKGSAAIFMLPPRCRLGSKSS